MNSMSIPLSSSSSSPSAAGAKYKTYRSFYLTLTIVAFFLGLNFGGLSSTSHLLRYDDHENVLDILERPTVETTNCNSNNDNNKNVNSKGHVHVLYGLLGNKQSFIDEWSVSLKSTLMNAPIDHNLTIHILTDNLAYEAIGTIFRKAKINDWSTRNQISIRTYEIKPSMVNDWVKVIKDSTNSTGLVGKYTAGAFFRLFAESVLPKSVEHIVYMDTDVALFTNLQELWRYRDNNAMFQWGKAQCSGFVIFNLPKMNNFWKLVKDSSPYLYKINPNRKNRIEDQDVLKLINKTHPELVNIMPTKWDLHRGSNAWLWKGEKKLLKVLPDGAGYFHINGGGLGLGGSAFEDDKEYFINQVRPWNGNIKYYLKQPWPWAKYIVEALKPDGVDGYKLILDWKGNMTIMDDADVGEVKRRTKKQKEKMTK